MANKFILEGTNIEIEHVYDGPKLAVMVGIKYDDEKRKDQEIPQEVLDSGIEIFERKTEFVDREKGALYSGTRYLASAVNPKYKEYSTVNCYSEPGCNTQEQYTFEVILQLDEYSRRLLLQFKSSGMRPIDFIEDIEEYIIQKLVEEDYPGVRVYDEEKSHPVIMMLMADEKGFLKEMEFLNEQHFKIKDAVIGVRLVGFEQEDVDSNVNMTR